MEFLKKKYIIIPALVLLIGGCLLFVFNFSFSNPNTKKINLTEDAVVDGLEIFDVDIIYKKGLTTYNANIKNTKGDYEMQYLEMEFYKGKEKIAKMVGYVGEVLKTNETRKINSLIDKDITDADSIKYIIVKK